MGGGGLGLLLPGSYVIVYFLFCSLKPGSFSSSGMVSLLSPHLCLPAQPLATGNFSHQSHPAGDRDPQRLTCGILMQFENQ